VNTSTSTDFYLLDAAAQEARMRELALAALPLWGLQARHLELIKYRENAVFRLEASDGARYALRIHRYGYHSDAGLRSELQWLEALAAEGIEVPQILPTRDGELFASVAIAAVPEPRQVDLFAWVDGRQLGSVEEGLELDGDAVRRVYRTIGALAARLHAQAVAWPLPQGFSRHAWDAEGLTGEQPFWGRFWELDQLSPAQRALLLQARERVHRGLQEYAARPENHARYSLIHADLVAENLLVDGARVRLIDFDDAGFGWHLFDLATALYFESDAPHFAMAFEALVEGYREHRELPAEQLACMPLFFAARSFTYLGWIHTRKETETARTLGPMLIDMACKAAQAYLQDPSAQA
jgi:Ser/Thr protein kinase RdoA (MazF antagonist)